jgi:DNA-3-methyladenine glycosylase I
MNRCDWAMASEAETRYHDTEWGVPSHDDSHLFEMLTLEGAQAGLSWSTILNKRDGYRQAFAGFDAAKVARFTPAKIDKLVVDPRIVRHRGKIESTVTNARAMLEVQANHASLAEFVWQVVDGQVRHRCWRTMNEVPSESTESKQLSKLLRGEGFRFVGPTTCYAFMQAVGMVNDHLTGCFRHHELR